MRLGEFKVESPPAASSGPSDVMSEIAEHDYELQSRWLVGVQVWGGGVHTFAINPRREFAKRSHALKEERLPERGLATMAGRPRGQGG